MKNQKISTAATFTTFASSRNAGAPDICGMCYAARDNGAPHGYVWCNPHYDCPRAALTPAPLTTSLRDAITRGVQREAFFNPITFDVAARVVIGEAFVDGGYVYAPLDHMPFDRNGCHATGFEYWDGSQWDYDYDDDYFLYDDHDDDEIIC